MNENDLVYRLLKRAEIRRQIPGRKSVEEGKPDRIANILEEAAAEIIRLRTKTHIDHLEELNTLVKEYHERSGTYNFHYDKCEFHQWDVSLKRELTLEQWANLEIEDWVVRIIWSDNSNSSDVYSVPLKEILEWDNERKNISS
jgi:hypothetical protein